MLATGFDSVPADTVTVQVDFGDAVATLPADAIGVGVSTYGVSPLTDPRQAASERALDARAVRIPVAFRDGRLTSGARGAGDVDVAALVRRYRSWGWDVLVVLAGRTDDVDLAPGDATGIIGALGYGDGVAYSTSNEPGQFGLGVTAVVAQATMIVAEGRALHPDFRIWGPAWSTFDRGVFRALSRALGPALAGVDYHRYAMGQSAIDTPAAMAVTSTIGDEVATTRRDLAVPGRDPAVAVDELNLTWRYENGVPGGDRRLFTSVATAWIASACGHIVVAGGRCLPYAMQNGPLGLTVEPDTPNPDNRPASTPMPAYWGSPRGPVRAASRTPRAGCTGA